LIDTEPHRVRLGLPASDLCLKVLEATTGTEAIERRAGAEEPERDGQPSRDGCRPSSVQLLLHRPSMVCRFDIVVREVAAEKQ
jgi:hypothetical protein